jgi:hypothetical protein
MPFTPTAPTTFGFQAIQRRETNHEHRYTEISADLLLAEEGIDAARTHDARHDSYLDLADRLVRRALRRDVSEDGRRVMLRQIGQCIRAAQAADELEDAEIGRTELRVIAAHDTSRAGAGSVELFLVGRARG